MGKKNTTRRAPFRTQPSDNSKKTSGIGQYGVLGYIVLALAALAGVLLSFVGLIVVREYRIGRLSTPHPSAPIFPRNQSALKRSPELFWGSYRPQNYFGIRSRDPASFLFGLVWFPQFTEQMPPVRHWCDQNDGLASYGWRAHDGRNFGSQEIVDRHFTIRTDFVKRNHDESSEHGGEWTARIHVEPHAGLPGDKMFLSLIFYLTQEWFFAAGTQFRPSVDEDQQKLIEIAGSNPTLGEFRLQFKPLKKPEREGFLISHLQRSDQIVEFLFHNAEKRVRHKSMLRSYIALRGNREIAEAPSNFFARQFDVSLPFTLDVVFTSGDSSPTHAPLHGSLFTSELSKHAARFDDRFEKVFGLSSRGFSQDDVAVAKATFSNLIGGMGYFYGASVVQPAGVDQPRYYWDAPLFTAVPSRSFFPRGFLWDEGFHLLLICVWDREICRESLGHWLDLVNVDGWIPREQILGLEARARVPPEFLIQHEGTANPPAFFIAIERLLSLDGDLSAADRDFFQRAYPRLVAWFGWFNSTQTGPIPGTYRWRSRNATTDRELNPKTLTSGLDDYPRASHPTDDEYHVDLRCWMYLAARTLARLGRLLGEPVDGFDATARALGDLDRLTELHWSKRTRRFVDYGLHTDRVKLQRPRLPPGSHQKQQQQEKPDRIRLVQTEPTLGLVDSSFGYVSLFPLLFRLLPADSPRLGNILSDLAKEDLLWTSYGLRSLARTAPLYQRRNSEHDPPYWRGAIWINMNYLTVRALHHYAGVAGPHQTQALALYGQLRSNLIGNMLSQYRTTGYIWEQYDDKTGQGRGSHPFTGWSSLLVLLMAESY